MNVSDTWNQSLNWHVHHHLYRQGRVEAPCPAAGLLLLPPQSKHFGQQSPSALGCSENWCLTCLTASRFGTDSQIPPNPATPDHSHPSWSYLDSCLGILLTVLLIPQLPVLWSYISCQEKTLGLRF